MLLGTVPLDAERRLAKSTSEVRCLVPAADSSIVSTNRLSPMSSVKSRADGADVTRPCLLVVVRQEGGVTRYHLDVNCVISQERAHHMWCADEAERDAWYQCLQEEVGLAEVGVGSPGKRAPSPDNFE